MSKEQVYDDLIDPLMVQIIDLCKKHKIAMISSFSLDENGDNLMCTTSLLSKETNPPEAYCRALRVIFG
jgi:hypothetical protein